MIRRRAAFVAAAALLGAAGPAAAQLSADASAPIDITSLRFESEDDFARSIFIGEVRAVQGEAILTADRLVVVRDAAGELATIEAEGDVRYDTGKETVAGRRAVYSAAERTITVYDDVVVVQGDQAMTGGVLVYGVDERTVQFTAPSGRVRGVFLPKEVDAAAGDGDEGV